MLESLERHKPLIESSAAGYLSLTVLSWWFVFMGLYWCFGFVFLVMKIRTMPRNMGIFKENKTEFHIWFPGKCRRRLRRGHGFSTGSLVFFGREIKDDSTLASMFQSVIHRCKWLHCRMFGWWWLENDYGRSPFFMGKSTINLVGGDWNMFYLSIYWEESSQLTFIFFRGVETTNQM